MTNDLSHMINGHISHMISGHTIMTASHMTSGHLDI